MVRLCFGSILSFIANALRVPVREKKDASVVLAAISAPANINARPLKNWSVATAPKLHIINNSARVRSRPCIESYS